MIPELLDFVLSRPLPAQTKPWQGPEIVNRSDEQASLYIYDEIGPFGTGAKALVQQLQDLKATHIDLHLNSPGGSVFEGFAIYNLLKNHPAKITTHIDGLAASIASVIALAGDEIHIAENGMVMIHNPRGVAAGEAEDLFKVAAILEQVTTAIVATYEARTTLTSDDARTLMKAETWFNAGEAHEKGFATKLTEAQRLSACFDPAAFTNAPSQALTLLNEMKVQPANPPVALSDPMIPQQILSNYGKSRNTIQRVV